MSLELVFKPEPWVEVRRVLPDGRWLEMLPQLYNVRLQLRRAHALGFDDTW